MKLHFRSVGTTENNLIEKDIQLVSTVVITQDKINVTESFVLRILPFNLYENS